MTAPLPPPGWYPDPGGPNTQRYFDGTKWIDPEGYAPLSQHPYFGSTPPPPRPRNELGIASLALGIIAFVFSWVPFGGLILGICAVVTGVAARKRVKSGEADNNGTTIASIALGIVAIIIGLLISIVTIVILYEMERYQLCIAGAHTRYENLQCH
jgi:ABC-type Fe3+ transport system permease subunit